MKRSCKYRKQEKGVTLIILAITIVIMLILAGSTITMVLGENGALQQSKKAQEAQKGHVKGQDTEVNTLLEEVENTEFGPKKPLVETITTADNSKNIEAEDKNGNPITIPAGFKIVLAGGTDEAEKVVYSYNGDGTPAVQDGIVIEDSEGNQFVWIPVGNIKNKDGSTTKITLGRYEFERGEYDGTNKKWTGTGNETLKQDATNYSQTVGFTPNGWLNGEVQELTSGSENSNTPAKNLKGFVESSKAKGGYYLARYEASEGEDGKANSQANRKPWTEITQPEAATVAKRMYSTNSNYEVDLINSYSWDTALVFIQKYSIGNSKYSIQTTKREGSSAFDTGTSGDAVCNIHDMASNCAEWSTEHSTYTDSSINYLCVFRGGVYDYSSSYAAFRNYNSTTYNYTDISFRALIY